MIRGLIFDFDGLILDTETPMRRSWCEIYEEAGLRVEDAVWAAMLGSSADPPEAYDVLDEHLGRAVDRNALRDRRLQRELTLLALERPLPGVLPLLRDARAEGLGLAVASSSERAWVHEHLAHHGLLDRFDAIVCAEDVAATKPAPDLFLRALDVLGLDASEAIVFEDSEHGVAAAKEAELFCVAVPNRVTRCLAFDQADLVVDALCNRSLIEYIAAADARGRGRSP